MHLQSVTHGAARWRAYQCVRDGCATRSEVAARAGRHINVRSVLLPAAALFAAAALAGCGGHADGSGSLPTQAQIAAAAAALPAVHGPGLTCTNVGAALRAPIAPTKTPDLCIWHGIHPGFLITASPDVTGASAATDYAEKCVLNALQVDQPMQLPTGTLRGPACWMPDMRIVQVYEGSYVAAVGARSRADQPATLAASVAAAKALGL